MNFQVKHIFIHALALFFTTLGYGQQSIKSPKDSSFNSTLQEVVVLASRKSEALMQAPSSVQKAGATYFSNSASPSFYDALEHLKGMQMITPSLGFRILNTRGFNNTTNVRFVQLVDGLDVQSPHIGSPIGNAIGPSDLDMEQVELLPGIAASLYGMNAINGLADFTTKSPFTDQGLSLQQKTGLAHLGQTKVSPSIFTETSLRFAKALSENWAFKINFSFSRGNDWRANDANDLNPNANASTGLLGMDNPAIDPVNGYGNESSNRRTLNMSGKSYVVARTGYFEPEVTSYRLQNKKADASLVFKITPHSSLTYTFRGALLDNVYQRSNRFRLQDYFIQQHAFQFKSEALKANVYWNCENTGHSYNLRSMAENLDRSFKSDNNWFSDYANSFSNQLAAGNSVAAAHRMARSFSDQGRWLPGSSRFQQELLRLQSINNWDSGAALNVRASFLQGDLQWSPSQGALLRFEKATGIELLTGLDFRVYDIFPDGNYFINPVSSKQGQSLYYSKKGAFFLLNRNFFGEKLRLGMALRADKNDYFKPAFSPRFTSSFAFNPRHAIRASWQLGYRFPIVFEGFSNVNSGGVKRVGGLPVMSNGIFENAWLANSISSFQSAVLKDINTGTISKTAAILKNKGLLQKNPYSYLTPEKVSSLEAGYRGSFLQGHLFIDADAYLNRYNAFIAQVNMNIPSTSNADSIPFFLYEKNRQSPYRMWTNSTSQVYNYGYSLGVVYSHPSGIYATANLSYAKLVKTENQDGLEDGFNTPAYTMNVSVASNRIWKNVGAGITWKWQDAFYWQSFLVNGNVPAYQTLDAFASYCFNKQPLKVKWGASNLMNHYYQSFLGGPSIGGFYYCTLTYGLK